MKTNILQEDLAHILSIISRVVTPRSTLAVLANVLLSDDNGRVRLAATNLEMGVLCWVDAKIEESGSITIPARTLTDLVSTLPRGERISLSVPEKSLNLELRCGSNIAKFNGTSADEFPPMPAVDPYSGFTLNAQAFKDAIHQVAFAASQDEARPVLSGVLLTMQERRITLTAVDGFRLAKTSLEVALPFSKPLQVIIPARSLAELARITGDERTLQVSIPESRNQAIFRLRDVQLITQLIEGNYPDVDQVIPRSHTTRAVFSTASLKKACKQAEIFAREEGSKRLARLKITPDNGVPGSIQVLAASDELGSHETLVDASVEGDEVEIGFNTRFLQDALEAVSTPNVALETSASSAPGVIRPVGEDASIQVIMPMHLAE